MYVFVESLQYHFILTMSHMYHGMLLLALSRYIGEPDVILITGFIALQWVLH
jgi:hypothetical protein